MIKKNYAIRSGIADKKPSHSVYNRMRISMGFFLQGMAIFLILACFSHMFHGDSDQHVVESILEVGIKKSKLSACNWFGIVGAFMGYYLVYLWFGITVFFLLPFLLFVGLKMVYPRIFTKFFLFKFFTMALFFTLWCNVLLGYWYLLVPNNSTLSHLVGGIGHELGLWVKGFLGYGTLLLLVIALIVFVVLFLNLPIFFWSNWFFRKSENFDLSQKSFEVDSLNKPIQENRLEDVEVNLDASLEMDHVDNEQMDYVMQHEQDIDFEIVKPLSKDGAFTKDHVSLSVEPREPVCEKDGYRQAYDSTLDLSNYKYPTLELLDQHEQSISSVTHEELEINKQNIVETLNNFKINIAKIKATIGPTVTLYEIVPEAGVKISKIKSLEDDIALSLAALGIRIIAPVPGKGTIGIEVPNKHRAMLSLRNMISCEKFVHGKMELPVVLGKSISNEIVIADLTRMPHLLIAGATGQGKSVGLNVLLTSLIYKKHPSQLKLVLVDPKKVELSLYNKLERHFLAKLPLSQEAIITETKKVIHTLNSLCIEMDNRYELLKEAGTRSIKEYNDKFIKRQLLPQEGHRFLPYIVLVIDEFADMMMTAGKEIEMPIARLAQLARAIGIHLVLATQRPSVNVITGIIKANFPVRISYKVSSKIDSRTILDTSGAEQLVGNGDLLLSMNSDIIRLQCPFLDTEEVDRICDYIGSQQGYPSAYLLPVYTDEDQDVCAKTNLDELDALFEEAARLVVLHQQGSTSLIQRKLKLGYNRSGRIIDQLEAAGIVGPFEGSKAREVLVQDEESLNALLMGLKNSKS